MKMVVMALISFCFITVNIISQNERAINSSNSVGAKDKYSKITATSLNDIDSAITSIMSYNHIPGLAGLLYQKGDGTIWKQNYGYANVELSQLIEDTTLFLIASVSKTIVVTALMQFWEADSFDLDDNINDYLDDFQIHIPYHWNDTITFRMLMTHTSSISQNINVENALTVCGDSPIPMDSFLVEYFTPGGLYYNSFLNFTGTAPGTVWEYSNVAISVMAYIVERFSGMPFDQYCSEKIFQPLEMSKTSWFLEGLDTTAIATPYRWVNNTYLPYCHYGSPDYPPGLLRTNKLELENFLLAYMNWGSYNGVSILDSSTVELILSDQLGYVIPQYGHRQGLIWWLFNDSADRSFWGHFGLYSGCRTAMIMKQEKDYGVILFVNSAPNSQSFDSILVLICDLVVGVDELNHQILTYSLSQNYPNPFNPSTTIRYSIAEPCDVRLTIFNLLGEEVKMLIDEPKSTGNYSAEFNASSFPSGVYFYQLKAGEFLSTKKMLLIK